MSLRNTEYATYSIEYGIDFAQRRVYFGEISHDSDSEIEWSSVERVIRAIHVLERLNAKKPIELHMSSSGGDCIEMLRLYDVIQSCSCQIIIVAGGAL
jgi:ATP-dependent protease ClpP protease subunit